MHHYRKEYSVSRMAKVLEVSESGYYKWINRRNTTTIKDIENAELERLISILYRNCHGSLGRIKITKILNKVFDKKINHKRVERIMKKLGLHARLKRKYIVTTDSSKTLAPAPNLINRDFSVSEPGTKLLSDTTYVKTAQGVLYVAVIIDLYGRMPLGLAMRRNNDTELVTTCFEDMITRVKLKEGCILHSDRGSTYASNAYQELLKENDVVCSMSRKGDCWDNAPMESFFDKLKWEWLYKQPKTIEEAKKLINYYVWVFYPMIRPHESLDYLTPSEFYHAA